MIINNFSHSSSTKELGCKKLVRISNSPPSLKGAASTDETEHISMRPEDMLVRGLKTYSTSTSRAHLAIKLQECVCDRFWCHSSDLGVASPNGPSSFPAMCPLLKEFNRRTRSINWKTIMTIWHPVRSGIIHAHCHMHAHTNCINSKVVLGDGEGEAERGDGERL